MVASGRYYGYDGWGGQVSIPFIAGQWSLLFLCPPGRGPHPAFQSPSLRGSGRFRKHEQHYCRNSRRFNPLHCGAVVASLGIITRRTSLLSSFNPLHCGAVVASLGRLTAPINEPTSFQSPSLRGSGRFEPTSTETLAPISSFNPLHCGAVVASSCTPQPTSARRTFQSPSLRGSGRFEKTLVDALRSGSQVSIPFIAGQWSLHGPEVGVVLQKRCVSIPFIAGQWSLPKSSGLDLLWLSAQVSIPFIAGQWSLQEPDFHALRLSLACFNPLHCGAVVASGSRMVDLG